MTARLVWERDGRDWPNREASRFVAAAGFLWHVQVMGQGPAILLLHGAGASAHSWRGMLEPLSRRFTVIAPDLPGQGFSGVPPRDAFTLPGMARAVGALLHELRMDPVLIVGHSAGAAIGVRMAIDGIATPKAIIGFNAALLPFRAATGSVFSALAKLLALNPVAPWLFARHAGSGRTIERLLHDTGSRLDARGIDLYRRLAGDTAHVAATLRMMANWNLAELERDLPRLKTPLTLVVGTKDATVPPDRAHDVRALAPHARVLPLPGLGHLAHEEQPAACVDVIIDIAGAHDMIGVR